MTEKNSVAEQCRRASRVGYSVWTGDQGGLSGTYRGRVDRYASPQPPSANGWTNGLVTIEE